MPVVFTVPQPGMAARVNREKPAKITGKTDGPLLGTVVAMGWNRLEKGMGYGDPAIRSRTE